MRKITKLLLEKVEKMFCEIIDEIDDEVFEYHNLKCYKANRYCWENDIDDKYFWDFCDYEYDDFIYNMKDEFGQYFDFWNEVKQVGSTSSFFMGYYNKTNIRELLDDILENYGSYKVIYSYNISGIGYDARYGFDNVERRVKQDMKNLLKGDLKDEIYSRLEQQIKMRGILKAYKDNEVDNFKDYYESVKELELENA